MAGSQTVMTGILGTVRHMSSETMREGCINKSSDIYSFGVAIREHCNGDIAGHHSYFFWYHRFNCTLRVHILVSLFFSPHLLTDR